MPKAHVLLFDDDPSWCRGMRTALLAQGFSVAASPDLESARQSSRARPPNVLVTNVELGLPAADAIRVCKRASPNLAVVVLGRRRIDGLSQEFQADAGMDRGAPLLEIAETVARVHAQNNSARERRPNLHALTRLVAIWLGERSGTLTSPHGTALMAQGAPLDESSQQLVSRLLFDTSELDFTPGRARPHPDPDRFGQLLFQAAKAGADKRFVDHQRNRVLQAMPGTPRIQALSLHRDTRRLLRDGLEKPLGPTVANFRLDPDSVGPELDALLRLGLLGLGHRRARANKPEAPPPRRMPPAPRAPRRSATDTRGHAPRASAPTSNIDALMVLKRLRRELERLQDADPWTVLGIPATQDAERIQQAADRMVRRYSEVAENPQLSDEIHRLARELVRKVEAAAAQADLQEAEDPTLPRDQRLFKEAMRHLERRDYAVANRLLRAAHRMQVYDPKYQAWLGRVLTLEARVLPETARAAVRKEASEMLQLAHQLSDEPEWTLWLAEALVDDQDWDKASRVIRLLEAKHPELEGLQALRRSLDAELQGPQVVIEDPEG